MVAKNARLLSVGLSISSRRPCSNLYLYGLSKTVSTKDFIKNKEAINIIARESLTLFSVGFRASFSVSLSSSRSCDIDTLRKIYDNMEVFLATLTVRMDIQQLRLATEQNLNQQDWLAKNSQLKGEKPPILPGQTCKIEIIWIFRYDIG